MPLKVERLTRLADLLEKYEESDTDPQFSLDAWGRSEITRRGALWWRTELVCHTQACAVGLACLSGAFASDGLSWRQEGNNIIPIFRTGAYQVAEWKAVEEFFGLTATQAERLFDGGAYDGAIYGPDAAKLVAKHIRALIAAQIAKPKRVRRKRTTAAVEKIKADALASADA